MRLKAVKNNENGPPVPQAMKAIHIILVERLQLSDTAINAEFICETFDMRQCAFTLTVSDQLDFEIVGFGDAVDLARRHRMRYNATAFSAPREPVSRQIFRTRKYHMRSMSF